VISSPKDRRCLFLLYWGRDTNVYRDLVRGEPRWSEILGGLRVDGVRENGIKCLVGIESGFIGFIGESICRMNGNLKNVSFVSVHFL
jgi:hypothetical protein